MEAESWEGLTDCTQIPPPVSVCVCGCVCGCGCECECVWVCVKMVDMEILKK